MPPRVEETIQILENIKDKYEDHHHVKYTVEALESAVKLSERYITDRFLPDKAIDVMDEVGARVHISNITVPEDILKLEEQIENIKQEKNRVVKSQKYEEAAQLRDREKKLIDQLDRAKKQWEEETKQKRYTVTEENVAEVVAMMTGIPLTNVSLDEGKKLLSMADELKGKVIGQDPAIEKLVKAIQRTRVGLKDPKKPIGSFIFLGPTGVGKTELAKVLATYLLRQGRCAGADRHERIHGEIQRIAPGGSASRLRGLRRRRTADGKNPSQALQRGTAR